jgi:PadR family transcriptional regulator PadR
MSRSPGDFEKLVLFALLRLGEGAYGVKIRQEITDRTGRDISIGSVYTALHRLEKRGMVRAWMGDPTTERGGRRKRHYELLPAGAKALSEAYEALRRMAEGTGARLDALSEAADV